MDKVCYPSLALVSLIIQSDHYRIFLRMTLPGIGRISWGITKVKFFLYCPCLALVFPIEDLHHQVPGLLVFLYVAESDVRLVAACEGMDMGEELKAFMAFYE